MHTHARARTHTYVKHLFAYYTPQYVFALLKDQLALLRHPIHSRSWYCRKRVYVSTIQILTKQSHILRCQTSKVGFNFGTYTLRFHSNFMVSNKNKIKFFIN